MKHKPRTPFSTRPSNASQANDSWPAFTDLLGAFVLVIFLTLLFFIINFRSAESKVQVYGKELVAKEKTLQKREKQLKTLQAAIQKQRASLRSERAANRRLLDDLRMTEKRLKKTLGAKKSLEKMFTRLKQERMEIEKARQKAEAALAKARLSLVKAEQARQRCQSQIEAYVGVRKQIMERVFAALKKTMPNPKTIRFDTKGGSIVLGAKIMFPLGRSMLRRKGKKNLELIWKQIHNVLRNPLHRPYIAGILVEGHTSSEGNSWYNWQLSSKRSLSSLRHLLQHGAKEWSQRGLIATTGYGSTRPIRNKDGTEDAAASRRIALRILFRDREQLERLMRQFQTRLDATKKED